MHVTDTWWIFSLHGHGGRNEVFAPAPSGRQGPGQFQVDASVGRLRLRVLSRWFDWMLLCKQQQEMLFDTT